MNSVDAIRTRINFLNEKTKEYDKGCPTISDKEWDDVYFELKELEDNFHIYFNDSPTQSISYEVVSSLEKIEHNHEMLSLEKTKSLEEVKDFLGAVPYLAMCKMDGLTCSLKYSGGKLVSAETRGNGFIGENILHNVRIIPSIPKEIPYINDLIVDGEIICSKHDFKDFENDYANPRNFAAGSIRLLDAEECSKRKLQFVAWDVIEGFDERFLTDKFELLKDCGFTIVPFNNASAPTDEKYGKAMGKTSHHFKNALAYKFYDETATSTLLSIDWTMGRTGALTPVAVFEPIELEGSVINRASLHNISVMEELSGGFERIGDTLHIYRANMIIPQVSKWEHHGEYNKEAHIDIPEVCPICGGKTVIKKEIDTKVLYCSNSACEGKLINKLDHFCGKKGLDIKGLSKATLEKLIDWGWVSNYTDLFNLKDYRADWLKKPGFGVKSVDNVLNAIENGKKCELNAFIAALGIPLIGSTASKDLANHFKSWEEYIKAVESVYHFWNLPNFGFEMHSAIIHFDYTEAKELYNNYLVVNSIEVNNEETTNNLEGLTFVITGKVNHFKNRDELKAVIESRGGKVSGSISSKTNYLINNDINSTSSKNMSAKKLNVPIITEENFLEIFEKND